MSEQNIVGHALAALTGMALTTDSEEFRAFDALYHEAIGDLDARDVAATLDCIYNRLTMPV